MTEKLRQVFYRVGNVVIICASPIFALFLLVGLLFNPTDAATDTAGPVLFAVGYTAFVICFYKFLRRPMPGSKLQVFFVYLLSGFILVLCAAVLNILRLMIAD
jgi:uncharacterized membrane protein